MTSALDRTPTTEKLTSHDLTVAVRADEADVDGAALLERLRGQLAVGELPFDPELLARVAGEMLADPDGPGDLAWVHRGACAELDVESVFPPEKHQISKDVKDMCASCPVRIDCVTHAYDRELTVGCYGGMSGRARQRIDHADAVSQLANGIIPR